MVYQLGSRLYAGLIFFLFFSFLFSFLSNTSWFGGYLPLVCQLGPRLYAGLEEGAGEEEER